MKLWGGRFASGPSEVFERFSESLSFDRRLLEADVIGSQTFARALRRAGIYSEEECAQVVAAFDEILHESQDPEYFEGATEEDVHSFVIRRLEEKTGALAAKIHTGRSRNEQVSLDVRLWLRETIDHGLSLVAEMMASLVTHAERYREAVVPGYTHLRPAQPVLWAHYLLAYFEMFARDHERLSEARRRVNVLPLGSGAIAGSAFPFDREAMAEELGFKGVSANSMDVSGDRDFVLDYLYAASTVMLHLSRLAEDWILYSSEEFGWLELADNVTSGSSLMPQKKNPDALELIRGKTGRVWGGMNSLFVTLKGLPMAYNRDLQEDKVPLFDAADQVNGALLMMRTVVESTELKPEVPAKAAADGWLVATDLAEALARAGTPFHRAHELVGRLVLESLGRKRRPADWAAEELAAFAPEFTPEIARLLQPLEGMATREIPGGSGPAAVSDALREASLRVEKMRAS